MNNRWENNTAVENSPRQTGRFMTRRRGFFITLSCLAVSLILICYKPSKTIPYNGPLEALLPATTAAWVVWDRFAPFVQNVRTLPAMQRIRADQQFAALLWMDPEWHDLQKKKDRVQYRFLLKQIESFFHKWFDQRAVLALLPAQHDESGENNKSGLLLAFETRPGFEQDLSALLLKLHPGLQREEKIYRGQRLWLYRAQKNKRSFSYCRLGSVIVLSLRSAEWFWLQDVVDRSLDEMNKDKITIVAPLSNLIETDHYKEATIGIRQQAGVRLFLAPQYLPQALSAFPGKFSGKESGQFWIDYLRDKMASTDWVAAQLHIEDQTLRLDAKWQFDVETIKPSEASKNKPSSIFSILHQLPRETVLFSSLEHPALGRVVGDLIQRMANSEVYREKLQSFEEDFLKTSGSSLRSDWLNPMHETFAFALTGLAKGLLPLPQARIWWECTDNRAANSIFLQATNADAAIAPDSLRLLLPPVGFVEIRQEDNMRIARINDPQTTAVRQKTRLSLAENQTLRDNWSGAESFPAGCFYFNFQQAHQALLRARTARNLWSLKDREDAEQWETWLTAARHLDTLLGTMRINPAGGSLEIILKPSVETSDNKNLPESVN